jgi:hypothetical protein
MTRFHVDVENQPRRSFDTAAAAVAHGTRQVYLRFTEAPRMIERLERGEPVAWSYGFASVEIAPCAVRTLAPAASL